MRTNNLFLSLILLIFCSSAFAQVRGGQFDKLMDLYVMGDYEKCLVKAFKMTEDDDTKRESEPYLYVSMCYQEISEDPELMEYEEYSKAQKDAYKYMVKFKKKDDKLASKDLPTLFEDNRETVYEMKERALSTALEYMALDNYRKAMTYYKYAYQMDEDDPDCQLIFGVINYMNNQMRDGDMAVDTALAKYREMAEAGTFEPNEYTHSAFEDGFVYYIDYLVSKGRQSEAEDMIDLARKLDPESHKLKMKYKELMQ